MNSGRLNPLERYMFLNNMVCVVKGLEGNYTAIDLRNESSVTGKIINVDAFMNIEMEDCYFYDSKGNRYPFESFFVKARNIRYVHIPAEKNISQLIETQLNSLKKPTLVKERTGKEKRAREYQEQILANILK